MTMLEEIEMNFDVEDHTIQPTREGVAIDVMAWHGTSGDGPFVDPSRGAFFSTDPSYAAAYGPVVTCWHVRIKNALVVSEEDANGTIEIDRHVLLAQGFDGRAIAYSDGSMDIVAFDPEQFHLVPPPACSI